MRTEEWKPSIFILIIISSLCDPPCYFIFLFFPLYSSLAKFKFVFSSNITRSDQWQVQWYTLWRGRSPLSHILAKYQVCGDFLSNFLLNLFLIRKWGFKKLTLSVYFSNKQQPNKDIIYFPSSYSTVLLCVYPIFFSLRKTILVSAQLCSLFWCLSSNLQLCSPMDP